MSDLVFEVTQEEDGGFFAECLTENIRILTDPRVAPAVPLIRIRRDYGEAPGRLWRGPQDGWVQGWRRRGPAGSAV